MTTTAHRPTTDDLLDRVRVDQVMHEGFIGCPLETPLTAVARLMADHHVHCVVGYGDVAEGDTRLWGVVSDTDLIAALAAGAAHDATAGATAATEALTIEPGAPLRRAVELMRDHAVTHLVVAEPRSDRPLGVLSTLDVARAIAGGRGAEPRTGSRVEDLMTTPAVAVMPDTPLKEVAALLSERHISGLPVISAGEVVGVVSELDVVLRAVGTARRGLLPRLLGAEPREPAADGEPTAADVMTSPAITIAPWRTAEAAATLMDRHAVKRLPVVRDGTLVGVVARSDLVRAFARSDEAIAREIREQVLREALWIDPERVAVTVDEGHVRLSGSVDSELEAELVPRSVRRVPGVVSVEAELRTTGRAPRRFARLTER